MQAAMRWIRDRLSRYLPMIKSLQTGLLLTTGLAGFMSARCPVIHWQVLLGLTGSLFLAISGSTATNMVLDRDIDARMARTHFRPLPAGRISVREAWTLALVLSLTGIGWAFWLDRLYGAVVLAGWLFDVMVYTLWLKRRTPWSIIWGGIAGGMPVLAGRALGLGSIDWVGVTLALAVLLWIPTHILTFSVRHREDYARAGIPTFPAWYSEDFTHKIVAVSSVLAAGVMGLAAYGIGMTWGYLRVLVVLSGGLLALAITAACRPSMKANFALFKYASIYMLSSMVLLVLEGI